MAVATADETVTEAGGKPRTSIGGWLRTNDRLAIFILELAYLGILLAMAYAYVARGWMAAFPDPLHVLPVAWFGAIGAVSISLNGVFMHRSNWDSRWNYWHISRPLTGALFGSIGYVLFLVIVSTAAGGRADPANQTDAGPLIYYSLAFLIGYREETFRHLLQKITDVLVGPGPSEHKE